jgi:hypothetical protein
VRSPNACRGNPPVVRRPASRHAHETQPSKLYRVPAISERRSQPVITCPPLQAATAVPPAEGLPRKTISQ